MIRDMICVACPIGCGMTIELDENKAVVSVIGNQCRRGEAYAVAECTAPVRTLTTTAKVIGGRLPLVPVKSAKPIPKESLIDCVKLINSVTVKAPVKIGDVIIANILGTGVDIVATNFCSNS
jgi:CxxC motif-containing protein